MTAPEDRELRAEIETLRARLSEAEQTLEAIRTGEVDALIVGDDVYTLDSANAASNRLRSDVLAQMKDAVVAVDAEERVVYLNAAAESQYGRGSSEVLGHPLDQLFTVRWYDGDSAAQAAATLRDAGAWRGECVHIRRDGAEIHVESTVTLLHDASAASDGRLLVSRDVSERYRSAAALREAMGELARRQREFATLVENSPFIFTRFDRERRHVYVSPRIEELTGLPPSAFIGKTHAEVGMPAALADEWRDLIVSVLQSRASRDARFSFHATSGELRHYEARLIPEISVAGDVESVLSIASDVTEREVADRERHAAEESLREADRRKDVFLATLAHELRNPLAPIGNALQIMRMSADSATHDSARGMIERQLRQLVHLVDDLLDVSRISQGKVELRKERIELAAVIANAVETSRPVIDAARHELIVAASGPAIVVDGDMTRLTQVVANLLNNAAKYTPSGGRITVTTRRDGTQAVIVVTDTGIGIPVDRLPDVFEMFAQVDRSSGRSQGGLGIGLALVKRLVEMHGGTVAVASDGPGRGSRFEVRLPAGIETAPQRVDPAVSLRRAAAGHGARILVADDNRDSADSMVAMLTLMGFETAVAYDGDEALQVASTLRPHAAILDIGMPRLSGDEVARRLRASEESRDMFLIALSGWGRDDDRRRTRAAGFDHHLVKPLDIDVLVELLAATDLDARATP